jgi:molybdopterin synthase catalytic subunit
MIEITEDPLQPEKISAKVTKATNGGIITFLGCTRLYNNGKKVNYLEYEAYRPMADIKLMEIVNEVQGKWGLKEIAISHRLGRLEVGEISLVVAIGAPHRKEAIEACAYAVDRIKEIVPIWKKETFDGGSVWIGSQTGEPFTTPPIIK